ncbi:hypothetical protein ACVR0S_09130 [Streptococcus dentapri]|uniref:Uncharacterized protein n=1 Tax=Streptococcus dentapri TaxID=573564 RepID=A0ABV8CZU6_9STRE
MMKRLLSYKLVRLVLALLLTALLALSGLLQTGEKIQEKSYSDYQLWNQTHPRN